MSPPIGPTRGCSWFPPQGRSWRHGSPQFGKGNRAESTSLYRTVTSRNRSRTGGNPPVCRPRVPLASDRPVGDPETRLPAVQGPSGESRWKALGRSLSPKRNEIIPTDVLDALELARPESPQRDVPEEKRNEAPDRVVRPLDRRDRPHDGLDGPGPLCGRSCAPPSRERPEPPAEGRFREPVRPSLATGEQPARLGARGIVGARARARQGDRRRGRSRRRRSQRDHRLRPGMEGRQGARRSRGNGA